MKMQKDSSHTVTIKEVIIQQNGKENTEHSDPVPLVEMSVSLASLGSNLRPVD